MKEEINIIYPDYLDDFKCIGGKCEDTCCGNWAIYVDEDTFEQYEAIAEHDIKEFIIENLQIREKCDNRKFDYAQIKLRGNGSCPFLDVDKYCKIQKKFGADYLSKVCASFPRVINKVKDQHEISLSLACAEAARVVLLRKDKIEFKMGIRSSKKFALQTILGSDEEVSQYANTKYLISIRNFSINLLQNRRYSIYDRLYMLGDFLKYITRSMVYDFARINEVINQYNLTTSYLNIQRYEMNFMIQISLFKNIMEVLKSSDNEMNSNLSMLLKNAAIGFKFSDKKSLIEKQDFYINAYNAVENIIKDKYSHIFENYVVNYIFQTLFPFSENDNMESDYVYLVLKYSCIIFLTVGNYLYYDCNINEELLLQIFHSIAKDLEHNEIYSNKIKEYLIKNELFNFKFTKQLL